MKLFTALLFILLNSAVVSAITEPNCIVKHGEIIKFIIITDIVSLHDVHFIDLGSCYIVSSLLYHSVHFSDVQLPVKSNQWSRSI